MAPTASPTTAPTVISTSTPTATPTSAPTTTSTLAPTTGGAPPPSPPAVSVSFELSGDVSDYDAAKKNQIRDAVASGAGVSSSAVTITITAASVSVEATIAFASDTAAANAKTSLTTGNGILASSSNLQSALTSKGVVATVVSAPIVAVGSGCANPCSGATCEAAKKMPCAWLYRIGCDCGSCCDSAATENDNPPEVCGAHSKWNDGIGKCELDCSSAS